MARLNNRIKQSFWYALYNRTVEEHDSRGYQSGSHAEYNPPVKEYGNISAAMGAVEARQFGDDIGYDRVIVLEDRDTPIDEHAVLWIDSEPETNLWGELIVNANGKYVTPWDYIVRKVGRGTQFGTAVIAVQKVNVS